jgi:hypothetical protein
MRYAIALSAILAATPAMAQTYFTYPNGTGGSTTIGPNGTYFTYPTGPNGFSMTIGPGGTSFTYGNPNGSTMTITPRPSMPLVQPHRFRSFDDD